MLAHDYSGHNGFRRMYNALKRQYYWPGMRKHILKHCKSCHQCSLQNQGPGELEFGHFNVPSVPMEFICMDLVGPISPQTSKGNKYMLTVIDMLSAVRCVNVNTYNVLNWLWTRIDRSTSRKVGHIKLCTGQYLCHV